MKIGAAFLISLATAQDYGLDGADVNAAAFDSDYNYDDSRRRPDKDEQNASITLDDLSSLLADYYGNSNDYSLEDYNSAIESLAAELGTTSSPTTAFNFGRPDGDNYDYDGTDGQDDSAGKNFENFETGALSADTLVSNSQTFCWVCNGAGATTAATLANCASTGAEQNCLDQGEGDYCQVTLRSVGGVIKHMQSRCAQRDTCDRISNFNDPDKVAPKPSRYDHCLPQTWNGNAWGSNPRMASRESVCSICHITSTAYGNGNSPANTGATETRSLLRVDGAQLFVRGTTPVELTDSTNFDDEWGKQTNNVLKTV